MADLTDQEQVSEEDTQKGLYLTFQIGCESYGLEIRYVTEIIGIQPITVMPELPEHIRGIINLRGKIIPVMDVRLRFKKPYREYDNRTCIVVTDTGSVSVGLIVDSVSEVLAIPDGEICMPPEVSHSGSRYIMGIGKVGKDVQLLLDCHRLLSSEEIETAKNVIKGETGNEIS